MGVVNVFPIEATGHEASERVVGNPGSNREGAKGHTAAAA